MQFIIYSSAIKQREMQSYTVRPLSRSMDVGCIMINRYHYVHHGRGIPPQCYRFNLLQKLEKVHLASVIVVIIIVIIVVVQLNSSSDSGHGVDLVCGSVISSRGNL